VKSKNFARVILYARRAAVTNLHHTGMDSARAGTVIITSEVSMQRRFNVQVRESNARCWKGTSTTSRGPDTKLPV
jgi:hypothetical protein